MTRKVAGEQQFAQDANTERYRKAHVAKKSAIKVGVDFVEMSKATDSVQWSSENAAACAGGPWLFLFQR